MPHGDVVVHVFGKTDVGRTREHNEDAFVVADLTTGNATLLPEVRRHVVGGRGTMFMVADGMGGAAAGEIASAMAIEIVLRELQSAWSRGAEASPEAFARALRRAATTANSEIHEYALTHPEFRGMGTTATVAGLLGDTLYLAQVGDSRAYLVRDGVARQITKDQSLMQKLVEAGELTEEEAEVSERRNIILQALGPEATVKVDLTHQRVRPGDTLVLCSDGLSGQVTRDEIARYATEEADLVALCKRLIDRANETGGPDNITVITARFEGDALAPDDDDEGVGHRTYPLPDTGQTPAMRDSLAARTSDEGPASRRPTVPVDAITMGTMPTEPIPVLARDVDTPTAPMAPIPVTPMATPTRRKTGMLIAIGLLALLIALAAWFALRTAERVKNAPPVPAATPAASPASAPPTAS